MLLLDSKKKKKKLGHDTKHIWNWTYSRITTHLPDLIDHAEVQVRSLM